MMVWVIRLGKVGLLVGGWLVFGYVALAVLVALVLLTILLNAESVFWSGFD